MSRRVTPTLTGSDIRLRELILYIATRSQDDERFGAIKLNKLLFYTDFGAFMRFGESVTGAEYQKLRKGPVPRRLPVVRNHMIETGLAEIRVVAYHGHMQHRLIPSRDGLHKVFDPQHLRLADETIKKCKPLDADDVSKKSHGFIGWKVVAFRDTIPYGLALIGDRRPTSAEREYGVSLEAEGERLLASA